MDTSSEANPGASQTAILPNSPRKMMIRYILNKIEGVNRAGGETAETIHHLFTAKLKGYITEKVNLEIRGRYKECIRMLNGF